MKQDRTHLLEFWLSGCHLVWLWEGIVVRVVGVGKQGSFVVLDAPLMSKMRLQLAAGLRGNTDKLAISASCLPPASTTRPNGSTLLLNLTISYHLQQQGAPSFCQDRSHSRCLAQSGKRARSRSPKIMRSPRLLRRLHLTSP